MVLENNAKFTDKDTVRAILKSKFPRPSSIKSNLFIPEGIRPSFMNYERDEYIDSINRVWLFFTQLLSVDNTRSAAYKDFESMLTEDLSAKTLTMIAEDGSQKDYVVGKTVWITGRDPELVRKAQELFDRLNISSKFYTMLLNTVQYGDYFNGVIAAPGEGVLSLVENIKPYKIIRYERNGTLVGFVNLEMNTWIEPWEMIHFRIIGANLRDDIRERFGDNFRLIKNFPDDLKGYSDTFDRTSKYGCGILNGSRHASLRYRLSTDIVDMARVLRTPMTRIHYIEVGPSADVRSEIRQIAEYKKSWYRQDIRNPANLSEFSSRFNYGIFANDVFMATKGGKGKAEIQNIGGEVDVNSLADVDRNERIYRMSLGIPDDNGQFSNLMQQDIRWSRRVSLAQSCVVSGLYNLLVIHFANLGIKLNEQDLTINVVAINNITDIERNNLILAVLELADRIYSFFHDKFPDEIDKKYIIKYLFNNYIKIPGLSLQQLFNDIPTKPNEPLNSDEYFAIGNAIRENYSYLKDSLKELKDTVKMIKNRSLVDYDLVDCWPDKPFYYKDEKITMFEAIKLKKAEQFAKLNGNVKDLIVETSNKFFKTSKYYD